MATPVPAGAMPHLNAASRLWTQFEEDMVTDFGPPVLASDLRELAAAATRAAEEIMSAYTATLPRKVSNG